MPHLIIALSTSHMLIKNLKLPNFYSDLIYTRFVVTSDRPDIDLTPGSNTRLGKRNMTTSKKHSKVNK